MSEFLSELAADSRPSHADVVSRMQAWLDDLQREWDTYSKLRGDGDRLLSDFELLLYRDGMHDMLCYCLSLVQRGDSVSKRFFRLTKKHPLFKYRRKQ